MVLARRRRLQMESTGGPEAVMSSGGDIAAVSGLTKS